jgi:signal transduction histidine kinase
MPAPLTTVVRALPAVGSWAAIVIALLVLWGWQADITLLQGLVPGHVPMAPSTALGLLALGIALGILDHADFSRITRGLGRAIALLVAVLGLIKLGDYRFGWHSGVDMLVLPEKVAYLGRPADLLVPNASLAFVLLGGSLALTGIHRTGLRVAARWAASLALLAAAMNFVGHVLDVATFSRIADRTPMALPTAMAIMMLGLGRLALDPDQGLMALATSDRPGGRLFRQLTPVHVGLPLALGWLALAGVKAGWFGIPMGTAALVVLLSVALILVTAAHARMLDRQDNERRAAQAVLATALSEAQAAARAKSAFLTNMSHELRTPLNSVIGFAEMIEDGLTGPLNRQQQDFAATISRNGHHLLRLINDLLDQAKLESGTFTLALERIDLSGAVRDVLQDLRPQAMAKHLDVQTEAPGPVLATVDPLRLHQVLTNLIGNAIKFTPDGGTVRVTVQAAGDQVTLTVRDSGIGIAAADQERIFHRFEQVDAGHSQPLQGTGLGLPIARSIVDLHGGTLTVASSLGAGAVFTITLPAGPRSN